MLHKIVRRPLFSAGAALAVLGATGAAYLATDTPGPDVAQAAYSVTTPESATLSPEQAEAANAQASADAAEATAISTIEAKAAAADEAARLAEEAAAAQAAAEEAEAARAAEVQAEREAAAEQASRDAQRDPKPVARILVSEMGWSSEQFSCLDSLWTKESNWRYTADNPTSSAYGIPQALPGSKMSSAGSDWATNPVTQITWGLGYIERTYGTPCSAWSHSQANNWY